MSDERALQIVVTDGADRGRCYPVLPGRPLVIGREPDCEIVLADTKISRRHCRLSAAGERIEVEDLGSRNGTYVNEEKIERRQIGPGEVLRVGRSRMEAILLGRKTLVLAGETVEFGRDVCHACARTIPSADPDVRELLHYRICGACVSASPHLGQVMGNFLVLWKVAEGGAAVLYRSYHTVLETEVALKIFRDEFSSNPRSVSRFIREARIGSQLSHPNIVRFYDAGRAGQTLYIAMEYVSGTDLAGLIATGPLAADFVRSVAIDILRALTYTNEIGVLHRDIKPGNILVPEAALRRLRPRAADPRETVADDEPAGAAVVHAKLADFNISKAFRDSGLDTSTITQPGSIVGTMFYMPPEQITDFANLDVRADLYSLGVSLYEGLTGRRPFMSHDRNTLARLILHTPPVPLKQLVPSLPDDLDQAILKSLAKDPDDRYSTPEAMIHALGG